MHDSSHRLKARDVIAYALAYGCWLVVAVAGALAALRLRAAANVIWMATGGNLLALRAVDRFGVIFLGIAWLAYVIIAEDTFRRGVDATRKAEAGAAVAPPGKTMDQSSQPWPARRKCQAGSILARRFAIMLSPSLVVFVLTFVAERIAGL